MLPDFDGEKDGLPDKSEGENLGRTAAGKT
jgi:hypothetical protein